MACEVSSNKPHLLLRQRKAHVHALESVERLALVLKGLPGLNEGPHLWASAAVRWKWNLRQNTLTIRFDLAPLL
jgi:hypothetical protein